MPKLNILMCCQFPLRASLGGPKGYIEIAETYRYRGHHVDLIGINEIVGEDKPYMDEAWRIRFFPPLLKSYLLKNAHNYDVIEYEAIYLPYNIKNQVKSILVARSVLLELHLRKIKIPNLKGFKPFVGQITKSWIRNYRLNQRINQSLKGMSFADIVNVSNPLDQKILVENGIDIQKIVMQPYGITKSRLELFNKVKSGTTPNSDTIYIAFVGSFDKRKGAVEFPLIIREITKKYSNVKFKLLGVLGLFPDVEKIYQYLGKDLRNKVFIQGHYGPDELPELLKDCSFGIFPSHLESFGFGVLEMMAMGLPVVGYDSPGLNMLIPKELLAPRGNAHKIINLLSRLIEEKKFASECVELCNKKVDSFVYETQENVSLKTYLRLLGDV